MLYEDRVGGEEYVKLYSYSVPDLARPGFKEATADQSLFLPTSVGSDFGPSWATHWIRIHLKVPDHLVGKEHLEFHWDASNEGLIWTEDGIPLQGLSGSSERIEWIIPADFRDGKEHIFYIEMACNTMFGNSPNWVWGSDVPKNQPGQDKNQPPDPNRYYRLKFADIVAVNQEARSLAMDFLIISEAAKLLTAESWQSHLALHVATDIMDMFQPGSQESVLKCRKRARDFLGDKVDSPEVYESGTEVMAYAIGHCHIDTCWLWPWAETRRKVVRSWANQCDLMDRYPEHRFTCSQPSQFAWLKKDYPEVFDRVRSKVKAGQFQPIGGSWVEHDTNMPSGESLVRQFLYGQRFFESEFGARSTTFWLPDTFGYAAQLPQLCRLAGMDRFFTQKLSWNNINNFPHTTFNWVAPDGSQVLCHMSPAETYNAEADLSHLTDSFKKHKSMYHDPTSLLVFGKGDGGGGPTWQHLEKLRRIRGLTDKVGGDIARPTMGTSVDDFYAQLQKKMANGTEFPTWYGELYFELHRGTYTTQANTKRNNRHSEILLHDVELFATMASLTSQDYRFPKAELDEMWKDVMLCQFHDCLPGSCIEMCYDESDEVYARVFATGEKLIADATKSLGLTTDPSAAMVAVNVLPWDRKEIVALDASRAKSNGTPEYALVSTTDAMWSDVKPLSRSEGVGHLSIEATGPGSFQLENDELRVQVQDGLITSLIHRPTNRETIAEGGKANQFVLFDDKPLFRQAWDVEVYHLNSRRELPTGNTSIAEDSPHCVSVVTEVRISEESWLKSVISLRPAFPGQPSYVEFDTEVEWREACKFLKVEFPVTVTSREASYESQYGVIARPTHYNTTWDMAKFEVCNHKWADLSEYGFGVSVINDSKYGFATCGNMMRLSLLRAPKAPDGNADMGRQLIRYALYPHEGSLSTSTVRAGFNFNNPLKIFYKSKPSEPLSMQPPVCLSGSPNLILDTIKRGEDDEDVSQGELPKRKGQSVIVRIYESLGGISRGKIWTHMPVKKITKCNILEDDIEELQHQDGVVRIELKAFEVATFRFQV